MSQINKTSFHLNGFWFHLTLTTATSGNDQHGNTWNLVKGKWVSETGYLVIPAEAQPVIEKKPLRKVWGAKEMFGEMRESYYDFFFHRA